MNHFALVAVTAFVLTAAVTPAQANGQEPAALDNGILRVEIDTKAGTFSVLDKRADHWWRPPDGPPREAEELIVPQAADAPSIDADIADWPENCATVEITPDMVADATDVDGPSDLSGTLRLTWHGEKLYFALRVEDEKLVFAAADEQQWWYKDSVEFWLNGDQYAIRFGEWGCNVWTASGDAGGIEANWEQTSDGYVIRAVLSGDPAGKAARAGAGESFRFALGINDCDGPDGRQGQLYYPVTWRHSSPRTFARLILADETGAVPRQREEPEPALVPLPGADEDETIARFRGRARTPGGEFPVEITFSLAADSDNLHITIDAEDREREVAPFTALQPLVLDAPEGRILAARYCNGIGVPIDDMNWRGSQLHTWTIDMPWVGVTDGEVGYMLLWDLPVSCDNGAAQLTAVSAGDRELLAPAAYHFPIKGALGEPREIVYAFCNSGGHVAICKQYRDYAREHGILVTQTEKMEEKPELARLAGAPDIWGSGDIEFCRQAKAAGINRMIVNQPRPWDEMKQIQELGYLTSRYDNYEDGYEGDTGLHGDFDEDEDVVIRANGDPMTAWRTMGDPPKQYMKRCSALYEDLARKWVSRDLEDHPYNARFIDVSTACGLRECYHPDHPLTRTGDRKAKHRLAEYVGDELGLVLGGEHGRWWGADVYDYWEGMQSGGFYSWPAGHVGRDLPQTREDISDRYLQWGLGETNRYPLWELVFHDSVVSTWYWGDSTGHLKDVAPELGYKKDAFNVLYGTVPLYWTTRPFSYRWDDPALRERLLESYRNTCKLAEQVAFEEMVSHEFVTEDRAVQKSTFAGGTEVWVNFGAEPWTLEHNGAEYTLPQYGFYAEGPTIRQYRLLGDGGQVTYIRAPGYVHVDGAENDVVEASVPVTVWEKDKGRLRVRHPGDGPAIAVYPGRLDPDWPDGPCQLLQLDEKGENVRFIEVENEGGRVSFEAPEGVRNTMIIGPEVLADVTDLSISATVGEITKGNPIRLRYDVTNRGRKAPVNGRIEVYADAIADDRLLAAKDVAVAGSMAAAGALSMPAQRIDGARTLVAIATHDNMDQEIVRADNRWSEEIYVPPELELWQAHCDVTVKAGDVSRAGAIVEMPFDLAEEWRKAGGEGTADADALRVATLDESGEPERFVPAQYDQKGDAAQAGTLSWVIPGQMAAGGSAICRIFMRGEDAAGPEMLSQIGGWWNEDAKTLTTPGYTIRFEEGYIRGIAVGTPRREVIDHLGVSSEDTGWVDEVGEVEQFDVLADGPVFAKIRVKKNLRGGHFYDKLYTFYPHHFVVTTLSQERFGTLSRAYYVRECQYADDKGNTAIVDGEGNGEGVIGNNPDPQWYATWADDWAVSCVALTAHSNITYWDGGSWGGIGFNSSSPQSVKVAYFVHDPAEEDGFETPGFAAVDYDRAHNAPTVTR